MNKNQINLEDLKAHIGYSFKNKQIFRSKQKQFVDSWSCKIGGWCFLIYLLLVGLSIFKLLNLVVMLVILGFLGLLIILTVAIIALVKYPYISYIVLIPLLNYGVAYVTVQVVNQNELLLIFYLILCLISYTLLMLFLPINIFRKMTPQLAFIPPIITILSQMIAEYKNVLFNLMTNNINKKLTNEFLNNGYLVIKNKNDFINAFYEIYNYLLLENKANEFYNQISVVFAGLTLTFLISGVIVTLRTYRLDLKANKMWKNIIYSEVKDIQYKDLVKCAYIGGTKYENLLLNNPQFLQIVKDNEEKIANEKNWKDKTQDIVNNWKNSINNYFKNLKDINDK